MQRAADAEKFSPRAGIGARIDAPHNVAKAGLGFLLWEAFQLMDTRHVFVGVVTFGLLGVATTWLLQWLERVTCPWIQRSN